MLFVGVLLLTANATTQCCTGEMHSGGCLPTQGSHSVWTGPDGAVLVFTRVAVMLLYTHTRYQLRGIYVLIQEGTFCHLLT